MTSLPNLDQLNPEQLRALAAQLMQRVETLDQQVETMGKTVETMGKRIHHGQTVIEKLSHETAAVVYDFSPSRAGEHARNFLQDWKGKLVCDDFGGYKASFEIGVTEIGCMAHARRKFFELHATNKSQLAEQALRYIQLLYEIESEVRDLEPDFRHRIRQEKAVPVMGALHAWMIAQRLLVHDGSAISKALDYSLKRWTALSRYLDDGAVPIDNNWCDNQIRPWALGRKNWLFTGSLRSGKRAAAIMSLIQSARLNGHDPYAYLKDVLTRLPTQRAPNLAGLRK